MSQRIIVIGAGFAGLWSALGARRLISSHKQTPEQDIEVLIISPEPRLVIRPRLYESNPSTMSAPLQDLFHATGVKYIKGEVDVILSDKHEVSYVDPSGTNNVLSYDKLILAAGSRLQHPDIPGVVEHTFDVDTIEGATKLDVHLSGLAERESSEARNTVVVCGGGFTGIEFATELPARLRRFLGPDVDFRVVMIDRGKEVGQGLGPNPRPVISQSLEELGVQTILGAGVTSVDAKGVTLSTGERIDSHTIVWTAGMRANDLTLQIPGAKDPFGRLKVDQYLRVPCAKDIFAAGDTAIAATDDEGNYTMMSCQHANPLGKSAGYNAAADLLGLDMLPYRQPEYVTCLDIGAESAVVCLGWDRKVIYKGKDGKFIKQWINGTLIYPPKADVDEAFKAADPNGWDGPLAEQFEKVLM